MGFVPQCKLRDYWQVKNFITQTPAFHQVMYKNHWCAIWTLRLPEFKKFFAIYFAIVPQCYTVKNTVKDRKYSYKHLNNVTMPEINSGATASVIE